MSTEPQFLSFKGLKQYTPEDGWGQVNAILQSHTQQPSAPAQPSHPHPPQPQHTAVPENVPTLTETPEASDNASPMFDPLIDQADGKIQAAKAALLASKKQL